MKTKSMISEGLTINQLEKRLEMGNGIMVCCGQDITSCGLGSEAVEVDINLNITIDINRN